MDDLLSPICNVGHLAVAGFFFLSGYGMTVSFYNKPNYLKHFVRKKVKSVLLPYWIINVLFVILEITINKSRDYWKMALSFVFPNINTYAWYIFAIFAFYLVYYFLLKYVGRYKNRFLFLAIFTCIYCIFMFVTKLGSWWYISSFGFIIGTFVAEKKDYCRKLCQKKWLLFLMATILFVILHIITSDIVLQPRMEVLIKLLLATLFAIVIPYNRMHWYLKSNVFNYLGRISMPIYLFQGIFIKYIATNINDAINHEWIVLLSILTSIGLGSVYYFINKKISEVSSAV